MNNEDEELIREWEMKMRVANRIVCEELGYPASEALFQSIEEWETFYGTSWVNFLCNTVQHQLDSLGT